jgi:hypothetical protein
MLYTPDEKEVTDNLTSLLDEMNACIKRSTRVNEHAGFESYIK